MKFILLSVLGIAVTAVVVVGAVKVIQLIFKAKN